VQRKAKLQIAVPVDSSPWLPTAGLHFFAPYFTWRVPRLLTDALESGLSTFIALRKKFTTPVKADCRLGHYTHQANRTRRRVSEP